MSSDSDVDAGFEMNDGNNIDSTDKDVTGSFHSDKYNATSIPYCPSLAYNLTFGGPSHPHKLQQKLARSSIHVTTIRGGTRKHFTR